MFRSSTLILFGELPEMLTDPLSFFLKWVPPNRSSEISQEREQPYST